MDAVELVEVVVAFGGRPVLDRLSFSAAPREFLCLLGPSGCGKSTTLRLIGGLLQPTEGIVRVFDEAPAQAWRRLAYVFQSPRLVPWRTALENVVLGMELRGDRLSSEEMTRRAQHYLAMTGLGADAEKFPGVLSGGERQRVALARALAVEPEVILMDEPFSALDLNTRERLRDEVIRLWRETRKTIVFVTHDLDEALYLADRVIIVSDKPTRALKTLSVEVPRPRDLFTDPRIANLRAEARALFKGLAAPGSPSA